MPQSFSVYVTRAIPEIGIEMMRKHGLVVDVSPHDRVLTKKELIKELKKKPYDAIVSLLTDAIDTAALDAAPRAKLVANYAVGFNNIDIGEAKKRGVAVSNTPDVLSHTVAEHTMTLLLAIAHRVVEGDDLVRGGTFPGWEPLMLLGTDLRGKTIGVLGLGRIGSRVLYQATRGFDMKAIYYDIKRNEQIEKELGAVYKSTPEEVLKEADVVSLHVPLLPATKHLINRERLALMKKSAYLVNTSRGPVIDEKALVAALKGGVIRGAALDVFEEEPKLAPGLARLTNVILTPHIASATEETRNKMAEMVARNVIAVAEGKPPLNPV